MIKGKNVIVYFHTIHLKIKLTIIFENVGKKHYMNNHTVQLPNL